MTSETIEEKVRRLQAKLPSDFDVKDVLTSVVGRQMRQDNRFAEIFEDLADQTRRLDRLEGEIAAVSAKLDRVLEILER